MGIHRDPGAAVLDGEGLAADPHGNGAHTENYAVDGDAQPPEEHGDAAHSVDYVQLDADGNIQTSQLPDLAITETYSVPDESSRLALTVEEGDVAIQTDESRTYMFTGGDATDTANWSQVLFPEPPVNTVFGRTGDISAQAGDYTAAQVGASADDHDHTGETINPDVVNTDQVETTTGYGIKGNSTTVPSGSETEIYGNEDLTASSIVVVLGHDGGSANFADIVALNSNASPGVNALHKTGSEISTSDRSYSQTGGYDVSLTQTTGSDLEVNVIALGKL